MKKETSIINKKNIKIDLCSFFNKNKNITIYYYNIKYMNANIKIKLSKNQYRKYSRYNNIPILPENKNNISNFTYLRFGENKKFKTKEHFKFKIGNFTYYLKLLNDIEFKLNNQDYEYLNQLNLTQTEYLIQKETLFKEKIINLLFNSINNLILDYKNKFNY